MHGTNHHIRPFTVSPRPTAAAIADAVNQLAAGSAVAPLGWDHTGQRRFFNDSSKSRERPAARKHERGTVLVVGLLILVVMMLLGLNSMQTSVLEELMAGQAKQQNSAFHAAEAGMQAAFSYISSLKELPVINTSGSASVWPGCRVGDQDSQCLIIDAIIDSWKAFDPDTKTEQLQGTAMSSLTGVGWSMNEARVAPHFVIEHRASTATQGEGSGGFTFKNVGEVNNSSHIFTVTAVGLDPFTKSRVILQSTIEKWF